MTEQVRADEFICARTEPLLMTPTVTSDAGAAPSDSIFRRPVVQRHGVGNAAPGFFNDRPAANASLTFISASAR